MFSTKIDRYGDLTTYRLEKESKAFASYGKGLVYIGNEYFLKGIEDEIKEGDVLVLDERFGKKDPNMKVISSYQVNNKKDREDIIHILSLYEDDYPSKWERSYDSMIVEWNLHNILYNLGIKLCRTTDVDLNNEDEKIYDDYLLKLVLR